MDIADFDRKYPTPAHASALELDIRHSSARMHGAKRLLRNRSGAVSVAVALTAGAIGTYLALTTAPPHTNERPTIVDIPAPSSAKLSRTSSTFSNVADEVLTKVPRKKPKTEYVHYNRADASSKEAELPVSTKAASRWIADPLSGEELKAALMVDKQKTIELNQQQLRKIKLNENQQLPKSSTHTDASTL